VGAVDLSGTEFRAELNGPAPNTSYDQLRVLGPVNLGQATLNVTLGFEPTTNDTFVVVEKVNAGPIVGTFLNLPEGALLTVNARQFRVTYQGGNGNDVVLQRVDTPTFTVGSIALMNAESMAISGQGLPFATYVLDAASLLVEPMPWMPVATNAANPQGIYQFVDAFASNGQPLHPVRFYRVRMQ